MRIRYRVVSLTKRGNAPEEYEDAFWPVDSLCAEVPLFRISVADGATETSFAALWARQLVRSYCRGEVQRGERYLTRLRDTWLRQVSARPLPWYAEEKVRAGAFSSFLGLTVAEGGWNAMAVGDSCLFQVRDGRCVVAFPLDASAAFSSRPVLLCSRPGAVAVPCERRSGQWEAGDMFVLMTDALAAWGLGREEEGEAAWDVLARADVEEITSLVERERSIGRLRNDDVTIVSLTVR